MQPQGSHNILRIVRYCLTTYNHEAYTKVFEPLRKQKPLVNFVYTIHQTLKPSFLSVLMIACYGAKAYLALRFPPNPQGKIIATGMWSNERRQIDFIQSCLKDRALIHIDFGLHYLIGKHTVFLLWQMFCYGRKIRQYLRIIAHLNRKYDFMPICMTVMGISYYLRFLQELKTIHPEAILATSYYSPDAMALFFAAKKYGIKTIFSAHAFSPPGFVPMRVDFDLMLLQSPKVLKHCQYQKKSWQKVAFLGIDAKFSPLRLAVLSARHPRLGIFLSSPVNTEQFPNIINKIQSILRPASLLIRLHPEILTKSDLRPLIQVYPNTEITFGTLLVEDVAKCDLALVGASGVTLQLLKMGLPCLYYALFEPLAHDYCGFIASGILLETKNFEDISIEKIKDFYQASSWKENFMEFDPFFEENEENIDKKELISHEIAALIHYKGE